MSESASLRLILDDGLRLLAPDVEGLIGFIVAMHRQGGDPNALILIEKCSLLGGFWGAWGGTFWGCAAIPET